MFISLKGRQRGRLVTAAGLRSLFRHHRVRSRITHANPHRLRHTFGADMVRAGMSLPALQQRATRKSGPPCSTSNSPRRTSGANTPAPSRSGRRWTPPTSHDSGPNQPGTDLRNANPDTRPHPSAQHGRRLSIHGAPLSVLSPCHLPTASSSLPTTSRSSSARLVPLAE
ncbi:MAG: phage integrase family protein [Verrucomicrobia bacterium]|nr:MAG: phage integrase family protein [Verrucomicrobiota bacterium]